MSRSSGNRYGLKRKDSMKNQIKHIQQMNEDKHQQDRKYISKEELEAINIEIPQNRQNV